MADEQTAAGTIRSFISIHLTAELLDNVDALQRRLRLESVRWPKRDQTHLTLKFLGDVPASSVNDLEAAIRRACQGAKPLKLTLQGLGCFPSPARPNVVWVGVGGDLAGLRTLHAAIEKETAALSEHNEKRDFVPHLTIGRVKKSVPFRDLPQIGARLQAVDAGVLGEWLVQDVHLMKSELRPEGAEHTVLASVHLD
jgi:2'-5' RNA ligase